MENETRYNLDLRFKLFKEYLFNGGIEKIFDIELIEEIERIKFSNGKVDPNSISSKVRAMMNANLLDHLLPPFFNENSISEYLSTIQKENNFDQINIGTIEQFDRIYNEFSKKSDMLFRGQREAKWMLYSKLQRFWVTENLTKTEINYQKFLEKLVVEGKKKYGDKIFELYKTPNADTENDIAVLSYLQHHGCPTPLLDWTYEFNIALYFALDGLELPKGSAEIEEYVSVYFIEEKNFEAGNLRKLILETTFRLGETMLKKVISQVAKNQNVAKKMTQKFGGRSIIDKDKIPGAGLILFMTKIERLLRFNLGYFSDIDKNDSGIIFSINNNHNIINQQGVFTWNANPSKPLELMGQEQFKSEVSDEEEVNEKKYWFCGCFNIKKEIAEHIRTRLEENGITREYVYKSEETEIWDVYENSKNRDNRL
jgi:hypothetical protein